RAPRLVLPAVLACREPQIEERVVELRVLRDGLLPAFDGAALVPKLRESHTQAVPRSGISRVDVERLSEKVARSRGVAAAQSHDSEVPVRLDVLGVERDRPIENASRLRRAPRVGERDAKRVQRVGLFAFGERREKSGRLLGLSRFTESQPEVRLPSLA